MKHVIVLFKPISICCILIVLPEIGYDLSCLLRQLAFIHWSFYSCLFLHYNDTYQESCTYIIYQCFIALIIFIAAELLNHLLSHEMHYLSFSRIVLEGWSDAAACESSHTKYASLESQSFATWECQLLCYC